MFKYTILIPNRHKFQRKEVIMRAKSQTEMRKYRFLNNEMTQEELGKRIGLSRQSICDIETGKRLPTLRQAYKISKLLNTTIEDLFFPDGKTDWKTN